MDLEPAGKIVLITGGSKGIGRAAADRKRPLVRPVPSARALVGCLYYCRIGFHDRLCSAASSARNLAAGRAGDKPPSCATCLLLQCC